MAGIRLHHPYFASCKFVVETTLDYPVPYDCPSCDKQHNRKAIHLNLDDSGNVIVAKPIYESLLQVGLAGMEVVNEVASPPPLLLGAVEQPKYETIEHNLNGNGHNFYRPGTDKYKAQDRLWAPFDPVIEAVNEAEDKKKAAEIRKKKRWFT